MGNSIQLEHRSGEGNHQQEIRPQCALGPVVEDLSCHEWEISLYSRDHRKPVIVFE